MSCLCIDLLWLGKRSYLRGLSQYSKQEGLHIYFFGYYVSNNKLNPIKRRLYKKLKNNWQIICKSNRLTRLNLFLLLYWGMITNEQKLNSASKRVARHFFYINYSNFTRQ